MDIFHNGIFLYLSTDDKYDVGRDNPVILPPFEPQLASGLGAMSDTIF